MPFVISIDQAPFQIVVVHYDKDRNIKYQQFKFKSVENFHKAMAINPFCDRMNYSNLLALLYKCGTMSLLK